MRCLSVPSAWLFELAAGAITDHEETCIPKAQREAKFTIAALHQWEMGVDDPRCVSSAEDVRVFFGFCFFSPLLTRHASSPPSPFFPSFTVAPRDDQARGGRRFFSIGEHTSGDMGIRYDYNHAQFLGRGEPPARVAASFGENWERLVALKKKYDPTGLFRNTFWPLNKDGVEIDPSEHEPAEPVF